MDRRSRSTCRLSVARDLLSQMSTVYYTATSLDGFIAGPDNSLDWLLQFGDGADTGYEEFIAGIGALAMGSTTYEWVFRELGLADRPEAWPYDPAHLGVQHPAAAGSPRRRRPVRVRSRRRQLPGSAPGSG